MKPVLTVEALNNFLDTDFPQIHSGGRVFEVIDVREGSATLRFDPNPSHIRPGGTVSGPSLFALADVSAYVTLLAHIGLKPLAVTANLNISFFSKAELTTLHGIGRILKIGRSLAFMDVSIIEAATQKAVAQATTTFAIPK